MLGDSRHLTSGRRLARNVLWNLLGTGAPLIVAIVAIPLLIDGLGIDRFGVLTIAWMVVGYFSLFDLGLGRALTKLVAEKLGKGRDDEIPDLVWTALTLMAILGVLGAISIATISPWLVSRLLKIPIDLQSESLDTFYLLSASIPIVIITTGLRGILEAHQRFGMVNAVRASLGIFTFLGPLVLLPFSSSLVPIIALLMVVRGIACGVYVVLCLRVTPELRIKAPLHPAMLRSLLGFGGWMTVTNIVGPLMVYMDRFLIGAVVSITAVAYYATPYEVITKLWVVPSAFMSVLFPAFAVVLTQDRIQAARLLGNGVTYIFIALFPIVLVIITLAHEGLTLWLGSGFADNSSLVLQLLAVGVLINSLAHVPAGFVQGAGRPDLAAKLHLAELPFYLLFLWWLLGSFGIVGAAIAWIIRVAVDTVFLFIITGRLLPEVSLFSGNVAITASVVLFTLVLSALLSGITLKTVFLLIGVPLFFYVAWFYILEDNERSEIRNYLKTTSIAD